MNVNFLEEEMSLVFSLEELPREVTKTIFLAGPCPRQKMELSWHYEALDILDSMGYDGTVIIPMYRDGKPLKDFDLEKQTQWEQKMMDAADCIVFWIPREFRPDFEMIGLTTNVEFGRYFSTGKCVAGAPLNAEKVDYLKEISKGIVDWHISLYNTIDAAVKIIGKGAVRKDAEVFIPQHIFRSEQFSGWYKALLTVGNSLKDFKLLYNFFMPIQKKLFMAVWKPSVYIKDEDRVKDIEFVIGRTDMSYTLAYSPSPDGDWKKTRIIVIEEFRSPVVNSDGKVFELPGGSSLKPGTSFLDTAVQEFKEETGLSVSPDRFVFVDTKQSASTLCSHRIHLFSVELTKDEVESLGRDSSVHGNVEDTERTYIHVMTVEEALRKMDWTNSGMVLSAL